MRSILEEETAIELEHINVKVLLEGGSDLDAGLLDAIIPIFHGWIQSQVFQNGDFPELLIDVADYRHVHHGPGVVLIGHEADYSIDNTDGRLGLRYNRKAQLEGTREQKLIQAARATLTAAKYLQEDTRLNGKLYFNGHDVEVVVNDRLVAPTNEDTRQALDPEIRRFAGRLFDASEYSLQYESDPRRLFGVALHSVRKFSVDELLQNLAG